MTQRLLAFAATRGGVFTTPQAAALDVDEHGLARLATAGTVVRVRRNAYVDGEVWRAADGEGRLALRAKAVLSARGSGRASHQSALALHRIPVYAAPLDVVDLMDQVSRPRVKGGVRVHPAVVGLGRAAADYCPTVSVPAALAQVIARHGRVTGVVATDHALRHGQASLPSVTEALDRLSLSTRLRRRADAIVAACDPLCESVGESRARLLLTDILVTTPHRLRSQVEIRDDTGRFVARVDLLVGQRVVVEFDGLVKYAGAEGRDALVAEKRREDALRALGFVVIRLVWADLDRPAHVSALLRRALASVA